jgi:lipopolysaccharide export system protein LptA
VQLTIERLRALVVGAGVLLVAALVAFLALGRIKSHLNIRELPKRLGVDIQQEANGVTYSHALGAHSQFKIHASKAEQLKDGRLLLHNVQIELYGQDGERLDRIEGNEFNYDEKSGTAVAAGPVEIMLMRPDVAPAIAPNATPDQAVKGRAIAKPLASAAEAAASGEVHVKTSGLTSNWHTGVTTTSQRVDFSLAQGAGSAMGATYDSQQGFLILDREVELTTRRGGDTIQIHAAHAEFQRDQLTCFLREATAQYRGGQARASEAKLLFREDGSAVRLDATSGFSLATATGGHLAAPTGAMDFDEHNRPQHGLLEGGVLMESQTPDRHIHGTSPTMALEFSPKGELRRAHLEGGVEMSSEAVSNAVANQKTGSPASTARLSRTWHSPVADVEFSDAGNGKLEPAAIHGSGGVVVTGESQRGKAAPVPSRLAADDLTGQFGPGSELSAMTGAGHASIAETTAAGAKQTASGDRLEAHFVPGSGSGAGSESGETEQIQSAILNGHVVLVEEPAAKPGAKAEPPTRATAGQAVYEGTGEWLHLLQSPRVEDGAMQVAAGKIDVSRQSGDAFAHGNVKATWLEESKHSDGSEPGKSTSRVTMSLGGQGPAHAVADDAQISKATDEATFKGHARLWQQANSISAPVIVLERQKKTLEATSTNPAEPVRVVLLTAGGISPASAAGKNAGSKSAGPSVIRARGSELVYSDAERKAVMVGGALGPVVAETSSATSTSNQVELYLLPAGSHGAGGQGQVDRMRASGHVVVSSEDRRGTGEQLTYTGSTGEYVLTGTAATPPQIADPVRGMVTGEALIFHSGDDSVSIEGGGRETRTETTVRQGTGRSEPKN